MPRFQPSLACATALALATHLVPFSGVVRAEHVRAPGDLDLTFGDNGRATFASRGLAIPAGDGKYWVAARMDGAPGKILVRRLLENGKTDPTFPLRGITVDLYPGAQELELFAMRRQSSGKIVLVGRLFLVDGTTAPLFARLGLDGRLDTSFGRNGIRLVDFDDGARTRFVNGVDIQPDDKIVTSTLSAFEEKIYPRIVRLHADGDQDTSFGRNGVVYDVPEGTNLLSTLALDDGKLLFGGMSAVNASAVITRRRSDGSLDTDFGDAGFVFLRDKSHPGMRVGSMALSAIGNSVVVGGISETATVSGWVARVTPDGRLDPGFNGGLPLFTDHLSIYSLAVQPDEKIVLRGASRTSWPSLMAVGRTDRNGVFDTSFGTDGIALTPPPVQAPYSNIYSYSEIQGPKLFISDVVAQDDIYEIQLLRYDLKERRQTSPGATPE